MAFAPHFRRDAKRQPRGLALLAVLLLHAGIAAGILLPRPEGESSRGAVAEPPVMMLVSAASPTAANRLPEAMPEARLAEIPLPPGRPPEIAVAVASVNAQAATSEHAPAFVPSLPARTAASPVAVAAPQASPAPVMAASPAVAENYQKTLWQWVAARRPQGIHLEGEAVVTFALDRGGRLLSAHIERTSGNRLLDRLALRTVRAAAPYPAPPAALADEALRFSLEFSFR